ncbi:putative metalloprotease CJM1_0395 family protein [Lysinibacillus sp. NPDC093210]|uniref:putative metalloprotease CJM1_0395 family protein n=1 Tax=Lysinibacillus sp. NPDC093210 TaxID=3364133 RepID=UPI003803AFA4
MKLSNMIEQERQSAHYNRKKILQRKEAGDAYRKNAQYFQPEKNPILLELENLLLGRQDQDLYKQHKEESKEVTPQQQAMIHDFQQTEKSVRAHEQAYKTIGSDIGESSSSSWLKASDDRLDDLSEAKINTDDTEAVDTLHILQQVRSAALTPTVPSPQDLRIVASAEAQMQQIQVDINGIELDETVLNELEPPYAPETIDVKVPERFSKELNLDPFADTIFGKSYDEALKARTFKIASAKYATHIQMAKSGYLYGDNSTFSMTA